MRPPLCRAAPLLLRGTASLSAPCLAFAVLERAPALAWASAAVLLLCAVVVGFVGPYGTARVVLLELVNAAAFAAAGWRLLEDQADRRGRVR